MISAAVVVAGAWAFQGDRVRDMWWSVVAEGALTEAEQATLRDCGALDWWGWLRVLEQDAPHDCGLAWARDDLARMVRGPGRVAWLQAGQARPWPARSRLVAALALEAAGEPPVRQPAWLALEPSLPDDARQALWADPSALGHPPGARSTLLARAHALHDDELTSERSSALWTLAKVGGEPAAVAHEAATAVLGVTDEELESFGRRPPHTLPGPWADAVASYASCTGDCLPRLLALVDVLVDDPAGLGQPADPPAPLATSPTLVQGLLDDPRGEAAVAELLSLDAAWVSATSSPQRLASLVRRPGPIPESFATQLWTGRLPPATAALVVRHIGAQVGLDVVVAADLSVQLGAMTGRLCAPPGPDGLVLAPRAEISGAPLDDAVLRRWAREEGGRHPSPSTESVGRRVGAALRAGDPEPPAHPCPPPSAG